MNGLYKILIVLNIQISIFLISDFNDFKKSARNLKTVGDIQCIKHIYRVTMVPESQVGAMFVSHGIAVCYIYDLININSYYFLLLLTLVSMHCIDFGIRDRNLYPI